MKWNLPVCVTGVVVMRSASCSTIIYPVSELKNVLITAILKEKVTSFDVILPSNPISPTLANPTQQWWPLAWTSGPASYWFFQICHSRPLLSSCTRLILCLLPFYLTVNEVFWKGFSRFFCPTFTQDPRHLDSQQILFYAWHLLLQFR